MTDQLDLTELRRQVADEGVADLDGLLRRLHAEGIGAGDALEEDVAGDGAVTAPPSVRQPMRTPALDLVIDGDRHDPSVYRELAGRDLTYLPGTDGHREPILYAFTTPSGLSDHLAATAPLSTALGDDIGTTNPDSLSTTSVYFEHADQGGDRLSNNPGRAWRDLTRVRRGFLGLGDWNDVISSVDWCRWDVMLYEHVGYGGARLFLRAGRTYNRLSDFGWNDVASSVANFGTRR